MNADACKPIGERADAPNVLLNVPRCMCVQTGCRAGPGCPLYNDNCKRQINAAMQQGQSKERG